MEDTDLFQWTRRPGFSIFCPVPLLSGEIVNEFYSNRNLDGDVIAVFDSTQRLSQFTDADITTIFTKSTDEQGFVSQIGNFAFFSDGATNDFQMWDTTEPLSDINPSSWGIPAPTLTPTIFSPGCWLPFVNKVVNNAILDPNGNVEVVTAIIGGSGITGGNEPPWPTTALAKVGDGSVQWTNMGPLLTWQPDTAFPVPVVISDTNGNLQLCTVTTNPVADWNSGDAYVVGDTVFFGGNYWTATTASTNVPPNAINTNSTPGGQPYWVLSQNPVTTGSVAPVWATAVGATTDDGDYTWTNLGPGTLIESFGTSYVYCYRTIYGGLTTASPISLNTGSIFGPQIASITSYAIVANIVTFQGTNNFIPGNTFSVASLTSPAGLAMDNQIFIVLPGVTTTAFSAYIPAAMIPLYSNVGTTADSGATVNLVATITGEPTDSPLCNAVVSITATEVLAGVVTVYAVNNFTPGLFVTFAGVSVATFLNGSQFQIINVDPNGAWFQVYYTTDLGIVPPNQVETTDTGTATFNAIEIYRLSDGGGIYLFAGAITNPTNSGGGAPYDSGLITAGVGTDNGIPGTYTWTNPNNVTSATNYATVTVPTPSGGGGQFTSVQYAQAIFNDTAANTSPQQITVTFSSPVSAGNTILVAIQTFQVGAWSVTDSNGNSYTEIASQASPNDHGFVYVRVYKASGVAAGATTVKLTVSSLAGNTSQYWGIQAIEIAGFNGTVEGPESQYQASGTTLNAGTTLTTTAANTAVFSFVWSDLGTLSGSPATRPAGYVLQANQVVHDASDGNSYQQMAIAYQQQSSTGSFLPNWSTPANGKGIAITLAFDLYTTGNPSDGLQAQNFGFTVPAGTMITGIKVELDSLVSASAGYAFLEVQLLRAGTPFGNVKQITLTTSNATYPLGGAGDTWGGIWNYSDFNNADWGVQVTAFQISGGSNATFSVRNVRAELLGGPATTWVYNDFTTDANLDELLIAPQNHQNDPPPGAPGSSVTQTIGTVTVYWNGRVWMVSGNYVYYTAGPDCTNGDPNSSWPPANRFQFPGPPLNLIPTPDGGGLIVCLADRYNAILGGPETISFYPTDALSNIGISTPNAIFRDRSTIGQFTTQGQYTDLIGGNAEDTGQHVADYLVANFPNTTTYATMHRNGLDVGLFLSNGTDQVLRYGSNIQAWSVPSYPIGGAGALRSIETSVGVNSLMLASPTAGGPNQSNGPMNPTSGANGSGGNAAWTNPMNITLGVPTDYAVVTVTPGGIL